MEMGKCYNSGSPLGELVIKHLPAHHGCGVLSAETEASLAP